MYSSCTMSDRNLQARIRQQLLERFTDFKIGDRLPSDRALAKEFGVAYLTINRLMSQLDHEGYVERVARSGTFLASRERLTAHDHFSGTESQSSILCAYPNYYSFSIWQRLANIEQGCVHRGQGYIEYKMSPDSSYEKLIAFIKKRNDIKGLMLIPNASELGKQHIALLSSLNIPISLFEYATPIIGHDQFHTFSTDWHRMGYLKAEALIKRGHKKLCFVAHDPKSIMNDKHIEGIHQALRDMGLKKEHLHIQGKGIKSGESARDAAYDLTQQAIKNRKRHQSTAFIYGSYGAVPAALRALYEHNMNVPDDISIIATGKGNGEEAFERPSISTVANSLTEEVNGAFDFLKNPQDFNESMTLYYPELIERDSIKAI